MANDNTLNHKRIRLRIPKNYHQEPVISRLVSDYGLTVNITAAILGANAVGDGWFDLELKGTDSQIQSGLAYLQDLKLEVWDDTKTDAW
jgi:ABC-type methionine transport system ATPase subunit